MHGKVKLINVLQIEFVSIKIEKNIDDNEQQCYRNLFHEDQLKY